MPRADASRQHCAIYTRKSSEEGLEQEFNSLAAQREACEAFICDQRNEGWVLVRTRYDDGGFSASKLPTPQTEAKGGKQSAYFVVELEITNQTAMEPCRAAVPAMITQYGGRFLTAAAAPSSSKAGRSRNASSSSNSPTPQRCKRWYNSPEYQKILPDRLDNSTGRAFVVEGVS